MISFKQFIKEAKASDFTNLPGFDPENNAEHKELLNAWNATPNLPTHKANKIRSIDELRSEVEPGLKKLSDIVKDKEAFNDGSVEKVYHNSGTGVVVYKPHNAKGCKAAGGGSIGCVYGNDSSYAFPAYDASGNHSYIIHLNKLDPKEDKNLSRINIFGLLPNEDSKDENFQNKGNVRIDDDDWNRLVKDHKLSDIPQLNGIRGIPINIDDRKQELSDNIARGSYTAKELEHAKTKGYYDPKNDELLPNGFQKKLESGNFSYNDVLHSIIHGYWNDDLHKESAKHGLVKKLQSGFFFNPITDDMGCAIERKYWDPALHADLAQEAFKKQLEQGAYTNAILHSAKMLGLWKTRIHVPILKRVLSASLNNGDFLPEQIKTAKEHGFWDNNIHLNEAKQGLKKMKDKGLMTNDDIEAAKEHGYWVPELHESIYA